MGTFELKSRTVPLSDQWDVIVVGGGPSGCTAAAAAAREGARTLLIEMTGCLGGMGTSGLVPAWCPFSNQEEIIYRGMGEKIFNACKAGMPHVKPDALDWVPIDPELLKRIYDELVSDSGAKVLFFSQVVGVEQDGAGRVTELLVANKAGLTAYRASVIVDCSGDADVCAFAGVDFEQGDAEGELMPVTHCFVLSNVDEYAYHNSGKLYGSKVQWQMAEDPGFPLIKDAHLCVAHQGPGTFGFNAGHLWDVDPTDPTRFAQAMMDGRQLVKQLRDGLAKYAPMAFSNSFIANTGSLMGIRETRRVIGDYLLTIEDWINRQTFEDEICRNCYFIDIHTAKAEVEKSVKEHKSPVEHRVERYKPGESHGLPYRCLTPKVLTNVLVAGRSVSTDRIVQGSTRVMPVCLAMGEAAGLAAAMATKVGGETRAIDVQDLRGRLRAYGQYLP